MKYVRLSFTNDEYKKVNIYDKTSYSDAKRNDPEIKNLPEKKAFKCFKFFT